jgi:hypothetical protein
MAMNFTDLQMTWDAILDHYALHHPERLFVIILYTGWAVGR